MSTEHVTQTAAVIVASVPVSKRVPTVVDKIHDSLGPVGIGQTSTEQSHVKLGLLTSVKMQFTGVH